MKQDQAERSLLLAGFLLDCHFDPEDGSDIS
jgi:hypothetical protein